MDVMHEVIDLLKISTVFFNDDKLAQRKELMIFIQLYAKRSKEVILPSITFNIYRIHEGN